ncbi:MAG: hypothetical protein AAF702_51965, partial [Chloroflexota bacterium]
RQILVPFRTPFFPLLGAERLFYTTFFSFGHAPMLDLFFLCPNSQTQGLLDKDRSSIFTADTLRPSM